ncbi:hypothetical protein D3C81_604310 [compost metagenome]
MLVGRVQQVAGAFVEGNASGADRAFERNAGNGQGSRGTDHRSDVRVGLLAGGNHGADDLHFVHEAFREQRTDRTVDQARGQRLFLGRTAFTLEEATRDLAGGVGLFLVVDRQREETLAWIGLLGTDHGHQHGDVVVDGNQHGAGCLTGNTARFESNGRLTELESLDYRVHGFLPFSVALGGTGFLRILGQNGESAPLTVQIQHEAGSLAPSGKTAQHCQAANLGDTREVPNGSAAKQPCRSLRHPTHTTDQAAISDAGPGDRSGRCNEWCLCPSGSPAAYDAG